MGVGKKLRSPARLAEAGILTQSGAAVLAIHFLESLKDPGEGNGNCPTVMRRNANGLLEVGFDHSFTGCEPIPRALERTGLESTKPL